MPLIVSRGQLGKSQSFCLYLRFKIVVLVFMLVDVVVNVRFYQNREVTEDCVR